MLLLRSGWHHEGSLEVAAGKVNLAKGGWIVWGSYNANSIFRSFSIGQVWFGVEVETGSCGVGNGSEQKRGNHIALLEFHLALASSA